jgi:hypothetical protein
MTAEGQAGNQPAAAPPTSLTTRLRLASVAPLLAVLLAAVAIAAAYLISHTSAPRGPRTPGGVSSLAPSYPAPTLADGLGSEAGPDGTVWKWTGADASFQLTSEKQNWVAFRALGRDVRRTVEFTGPAAERVSVTVGTAPQVYLVGPLSAGRVAITVSRSRKEGPNERLLFVSSLRATPNPVAVVPGTGFWTSESSGGVVFNWLRGTGALDVYAPRATTGRLWLTFVARSLGEDRSLTIQSGSSTQQIAVGTTAQGVTAGPFKLTGGRAHVILNPAPGPARYGSDPRSLSVQVAGLGGYTAPGEA